MSEDKISNNVTGTLDRWHYDSVHNVVWGYIDYDVKGRFPDGSYVHTSSLPSYKEKTFDRVEGDLIYTRNSIYRLGKKHAAS